jgi:hypothetical protein
LAETGALGEALAVSVATRGKTMTARAALRPTAIDRTVDIVATPFSWRSIFVLSAV